MLSLGKFKRLTKEQTEGIYIDLLMRVGEFKYKVEGNSLCSRRTVGYNKTTWILTASGLWRNL